MKCEVIMKGFAQSTHPRTDEYADEALAGFSFVPCPKLTPILTVTFQDGGGTALQVKSDSGEIDTIDGGSPRNTIRLLRMWLDDHGQSDVEIRWKVAR